MRLFRVFCFFFLIPAIAGCAGLAPSRPSEPPLTTISQPTEFLYVGTAPGLVKYGILSDGSLQPSAINSSVPQICSPELSLVGEHIFSLSRPCFFSPSETELRRLDLGAHGDIVASTPPLSLPGLPSASGFAMTFIPGVNGKFAYAGSIGPDGRQNITPIQISTEGDLTVMPEPRFSWPPLALSGSNCSEDHVPDAVVQTPTGPYISVRHQVSCPEQAGPTIDYSLYKLDNQTGAPGNLLGVPLIAPAPETIFATYNGPLLLIGDTHPLPGFGSGTLDLNGVNPAGSNFANDPSMTFLRQCNANHAACSHPVAGTFHPSGKWLFIVDRQAGGVWTIPVSSNSMSPENASFAPALLLDGFRFAFSSTGKFLYVAERNGTSAEIQGFQVDDTTGALSRVKGSPWPIGNVGSVTSIIDVPVRK
ncbi:MAG TPA: beta-propeller fold lactonase family protein [Candidatus Angelobacter sp.]|jgi:hypothetical protein|nr:beta-propeller fold lactonase family protein [Candidatus Angelobacter sp.]